MYRKASLNSRKSSLKSRQASLKSREASVQTRKSSLKLRKTRTQSGEANLKSRVKLRWVSPKLVHYLLLRFDGFICTCINKSKLHLFSCP